MKYELETIPVWEAYKQDSECPLCILEKKIEGEYVKFFLGDSIMDPPTRVEVNKKGFCPSHLELLFEGGHKLGVGLMTHTYLVEFLASFREKKKAFKEYFEKNKKISPEFLSLLSRTMTQCVFCDRLAQTIDRYIFTITYLYRTDEDFKKTFLASKGFCVGHFKRALEMAQAEMKGRGQSEFIIEIFKIEQTRLETLEQEILWFTQKFDYRNQDKPWGDSRDALPRVLCKLKGMRFLENIYNHNKQSSFKKIKHMEIKR